jgi:hypothetical protein
MAETSSLISIEKAVNGFLLRYEKTTDRYMSYLEHACILLQDFMAYDSTQATTEKVSVNALGIISIPNYFVTIKDVCVAYRGEWWPMTEKIGLVNTTTTTLGVEGQDTTFGEGVAIPDGVLGTYGTKGGVNSYYYTIDWKARRIYVDGMISDTCVLRGTTSGIQMSETTYIPTLLIPVLDNYLLWKQAVMNGAKLGEMREFERLYTNERLRYRALLNSLSASQWNDLFWGTYTPSIKR